MLMRTFVPLAEPVLVIGAGATGLSCARFLQTRASEVRVMDTRQAPPAEQALRELPKPPRLFFGGWVADALRGVGTVLVSPGVDPRTLELARLRQAGVPVIGDVELFARHVEAPVLAITGSNGKSTVTAMVGVLLTGHGLRVGIGGNYGTPALDLLGDIEPDVHVLELSSYQLESLYSLRPQGAALLNAAPDHLDRYSSMADYRAAKARILTGAATAILNRDEAWMAPLASGLADNQAVVWFGADAPAGDDQFGILDRQSGPWLARGEAALMPAADLAVAGKHNMTNALAALALAQCHGLPPQAAIGALRKFSGLPHRLQRVPGAGPRWWNDSKATNVGAALAAIETLATAGPGKRRVLIAGGLGKGQDFSPLADEARGRLHAVVLLGADRDRLAAAFAGVCPVVLVDSMGAAVKAAAEIAGEAGEVLLSPACASQDMFADYADRGRKFTEAVALLSSSHHKGAT